MDDLNIFPKEYEASTKVLLLNFDADSFKASLEVLTQLRAANIKSEVYPDAVKIKKQMNYANKKGVPFVLMIGENELKEGKFLLKNMITGEQEKLSLQEIIHILSN
jgi:histidyl-tRNA synthetase